MTSPLVETMDTGKRALLDVLKRWFELPLSQTPGLTLNSAPEEYSDLTIMCGERAFKVHKLVVCTQSKPFAAMMRESWIDEDVQVVEDVLHFLYSANLSNPKWAEDGDGLATHAAKIYVFGDKWNIPALQDAALELWKEETSTGNPYDPDYFWDVIPLIWHSIISVDDKFKDAIIDLMLEDMNELSDHEELFTMLEQVPEFSNAVVKRLARSPRLIVKVTSDDCCCHVKPSTGRIWQCHECRGIQDAA